MKEKGTLPQRTPSDEAFKKLFGRKELAVDFLKNTLPTDIVQEVDFSTLTEDPTEYINKAFKKTFSDLVFRVKYKGEGMKVVLLLEHKSAHDRLTIFQVGGYVHSIWAKEAENHEKLSVVIPLILVHGASSWNSEQDLRHWFEGYEELPEKMKRAMPTFRHGLVDLSQVDQAFFKPFRPMNQLILASFARVMKRDTLALIDDFLEYLDVAAAFEESAEVHEIVCILIDFFTQSKHQITEETIVRRSRQLEGKGETMLNILEEREKKGRVEGNIEGAYKNSVNVLTRLLQQKLGALPEPIKSAIETSNITVLDSLIEDIFVIESYEDVEERLMNK